MFDKLLLDFGFGLSESIIFLLDAKIEERLLDGF